MDLDNRRILFVGGISAHTTSEELSTYFSQYGYVYKVRVMKEKKTKEPKGYAYVTFKDSRSIHKLLKFKHYIGDRRVDCQVASRKGEKRTCKQEQRKRRVFVANLPLEMDSDSLEKLFCVYGPVRNAYVITDYDTKLSKGYGYVEFLHTQHVELALLAYKDNINHENKLQCFPYLGRHEQKEYPFPRIPFNNDLNLDLLEDSDDHECNNPLDDLQLDSSNKHPNFSDQPGITTTTRDSLLFRRRWNLSPTQHMSTNLRFNIGTAPGWMNSTKNQSFLQRILTVSSSQLPILC